MVTSYGSTFDDEITRGDTWSITVDWQDADDENYDLAGYTFEYTILDGQVLVFQADSDGTDGYVSVELTARQIVVHLPPAITGDFSATNGTHSLRWSNGADEGTLFTGCVAIR
ncbi:MAG: hypothetical protein U0871_24370 [Gemmataceae bacterium]